VITRALRHAAVPLALAALATGCLATLPAPAGADVAEPQVGGSGWTSDDRCTLSGAQPATWVPWTDNGVPVTQGFNGTTTVTNPDQASDKYTVTTSGSATVQAAPLTGGTGTITFSANVAMNRVRAQATSACAPDVSASADAGGKVTLTQPTWVTVAGSGDGPLDPDGWSGGATAYLTGVDRTLELDLGKRGSGSVTTLMPPGQLDVYLAARVGGGTGVGAQSYTASLSVRLQPAGAGSAPSGKGQAMVVFGARDCATGQVNTALTKKAKKKAAKVVFRVNGAKAATFKRKKIKPRAVVLPAASASPVTASAAIKLANGKKATVTRSYLPCS